MPATDSPFIIGVIREREKQLLTTDHYQRLVDSKGLDVTIQSLNDTVYAAHVSGNTVTDALSALTLHLKDIKDMLTDLIIDPWVTEFISARYDGLNITTALVEKKLGQPEPGELSPLGSISIDLIHSIVWNNLGIDALPKHWQDFVSQQLEKPTADQWQTEVITSTADHTVKWLQLLAKTPLSKSIAKLIADRLAIENQLRFSEEAANNLGYHLSEKLLNSVRHHQDATNYEKFWDIELIKLIDSVRHEPIGYDPIIAFWFAKEIETRSLRLMLSAKASGQSGEDVTTHIRPLNHIAV